MGQQGTFTNKLLWACLPGTRDAGLQANISHGHMPVREIVALDNSSSDDTTTAIKCYGPACLAPEIL